MFCVQCGSALPEGARYCGSCGVSLETVGPRQDPPATIGPSAPLRALRNDDLVGIEGWLFWLVAGFLTLGPIMFIGSTVGYVNMRQMDEATFATLERWSGAWLSMWGLATVFCIYSMRVGYSLVSQRNPGTVHKARRALWILGVGSVVATYSVIGFLGLQEPRALHMAGTGLVLAITSAGIWTAYLQRSRRVHNTYFIEREDSEARQLGRLSSEWWSLAGILIVVLFAGTSIWNARIREDSWMTRLPGAWETGAGMIGKHVDMNSIESDHPGYRSAYVAETLGPLVEVAEYQVTCPGGVMLQTSEKVFMGKTSFLRSPIETELLWMNPPLYEMKYGARDWPGVLETVCAATLPQRREP